jgi:hypothetical protein
VAYDVAEIPSGQAGVSARREYERRKAGRENKVRRAHPYLGGLLLALSDDPQNIKAWAAGAHGEELLGQRLNRLSNSQVRVLHDRRIPGTKANLDYLAVTSTGVCIIDAKNYAGRVKLQTRGNLFAQRTQKLLVGSRDCTKIVTGMHKQIDVVRAALDTARTQVSVTGMLCFVDARWPLIGAAFTIDGIHVLWPSRALRHLRHPGDLNADHVADVHRILANAFPPSLRSGTDDPSNLQPSTMGTGWRPRVSPTPPGRYESSEG